MSISLTELVAAAGGGALGAALGALLAFALMGGVVVVVTLAAATAGAGAGPLVTEIAFGPVLGPHVTFAGGVAAAAFAAHRHAHASGRDIAEPLAGYGRSSILLVGAVCGVLGQLLARAVAALTTLTTAGSATVTMTDSLAVSVVLTAVIAALLWGRGRRADESGRQAWLPWQHSPIQVLSIAVASGATAGAALLLWPADDRAVLGPFLYGLSALSLIALVFGKAVPVTHHLTLPAAMGAGLALGMGGSELVVILAAVATSVFAGVVAELWARGLLERSRVHLDPPALAIAVATTALAVLQLALG